MDVCNYILKLLSFCGLSKSVSPISQPSHPHFPPLHTHGSPCGSLPIPRTMKQTVLRAVLQMACQPPTFRMSFLCSFLWINHFRLHWKLFEMQQKVSVAKTRWNPLSPVIVPLHSIYGSSSITSSNGMQVSIDTRHTLLRGQLKGATAVLQMATSGLYMPWWWSTSGGSHY